MRRPAIAMLGMAAGCASASGAPAPSAPPLSPPINAVMFASCGPTDGAATTVMIFDGPAACPHDDAELRTRDRFEVSFWVGWAPGQRLDLASSRGTAARCTAAGCAPLTGATLEREPAGEPAGWTGTLRYFDRGRPQLVPFRAATCELHRVCG